eukprot:XP_011661494.1 PREDICTED: uncharacterized protein LOC105437034 [Strongylocentrotus purpuratus]
MATLQSEDSADTWKYTCVVSKFVINCIEMAISKSFGVLIPVMITILSTNTKTIGLACSMPSAWMNIACPAVAYVLKTGVLKPRVIALTGAFLSAATLIAAGFTTSITELGLCLSLTVLSEPSVENVQETAISSSRTYQTDHAGKRETKN